MSLKDLLTTYWPQLINILTGIGVLILWYLNIRGERIKTRDSLFQNKKLQAIEEFYTAYAQAEKMWIYLPIYEVLEYKFTSKQLDEMITDVLKNLQHKLYIACIYNSTKDAIKFEQVYKYMENINESMIKVYSDRKDWTNIQLVNHYTFTMQSCLNKSRILLDDISKSIRKSYKN